MAFATGKKSVDNGVFKPRLFHGLAALKLLVVNPTKEELSTLYGGKEMEYDPVYHDTTKVTINGVEKEVPRARINIYMGLDLEGEEETQIIPLNFFITKAPLISQSGKIMFINNYGQTGYLTKEDITSGNLPENMKWFLTDGAKVCMRGEDSLIDFMRKFINIEEPRKYNNDTKEWELIDDLSTAVSILEEEVLAQLFRGDASYIKAALMSQPDNEVKVLLGVREYDGKEYQTFYAREFMRAGATTYDKFFKRAMENNEYSDASFLYDTVKEVVQEETNMDSVLNNSENDPLGINDEETGSGDWY